MFAEVVIFLEANHCFNVIRFPILHLQMSLNLCSKSSSLTKIFTQATEADAINEMDRHVINVRFESCILKHSYS